MKRPKKKPTDGFTRWVVYLLRKKAERIGSIEAPDRDAAKARALEVLLARERSV